MKKLKLILTTLTLLAGSNAFANTELYKDIDLMSTELRVYQRLQATNPELAEEIFAEGLSEFVIPFSASEGAAGSAYFAITNISCTAPVLAEFYHAYRCTLTGSDYNDRAELNVKNFALRGVKAMQLFALLAEKVNVITSNEINMINVFKTTCRMRSDTTGAKSCVVQANDDS